MDLATPDGLPPCSVDGVELGVLSGVAQVIAQLLKAVACRGVAEAGQQRGDAGGGGPVQQCGLVRVLQADALAAVTVPGEAEIGDCGVELVRRQARQAVRQSPSNTDTGAR